MCDSNLYLNYHFVVMCFKTWKYFISWIRWKLSFTWCLINTGLTAICWVIVKLQLPAYTSHSKSLYNWLQKSIIRFHVIKSCGVIRNLQILLNLNITVWLIKSKYNQTFSQKYTVKMRKSEFSYMLQKCIFVMHFPMILLNTCY